MKAKSTLIAALFLVICGTSGEAATGSCDAIAAQADSAESRGDLDGLKRLYERANSSQSGCGTTYSYCLGRRIAGAYLTEAYKRAESGTSESALKPLLEQARAFGNPWQLLFALAEAEEAGSADDRARFDRAAAFYQETINEIKEIEIAGEICPGERGALPSKKRAKMIFSRATSASRLAMNFVVPPTMRNGNTGGIFIDSFRGFTPSRRPVPVTFDYNQASLNPKGYSAAAFLLKFLKIKHATEVHLTGHTDDKGSESYNCGLSRKRLDTVKAYLEDGGYYGKVTVEPLGEFVTVELDDSSRYSDEERRELNRRVELQLVPSTVAYRKGRTCG